MTRDEAKQMREAFNAFCDGKEVQWRSKGVREPWLDTQSPSFVGANLYRVKPDPKTMWLALDENGKVFAWSEKSVNEVSNLVPSGGRLVELKEVQ